jgi:DNA helicase MCM8
MAYANGGTCLGLLIASLCPTIFGHELVKAGLLLGLFGGTKNQTDSKVNVRSDIHVLIVGDPGLGKSQMLRAASSIAPRAVYVCGNTSTTAGLTVAISREGRGGETTIEAGALVLSDQGVCCIDELDKMSCDPHALLEAMEQQSISIAKSGMVTSLKSRASVLAAANPIGGHYNRRKTVCENLKMATALLTRFDLVFILLDKPDDGHDRKISEHIMRTHALASNLADTSVISDDMFTGFSSHIENNDSSEMTLSQRLRREANFFSERPLNPDILRKYVEFSRQHIHPKLTAAAAKVLQRLYLTLRSQQSLGKSIPVTTRHLESLIRLSQARAKIELRDEVTEDDAKDVVQLLQESLLDAFTTETGEIDLKRKGGMSIAKQVKALAQMLSKEANLKGSTMFSRVEILEIILRMKLEKDGSSLIDVMMTESYLLAKGNKTYQLAAT